MERAMHQSNGMSYAEYSRKLEKRLAVERRREKDYQESRKLLSDLEGNRSL
ncbi:hypothetical protein LC040_14610 [Bacillus tianshenii]|nr:hypothetical protein LC040_14610 [Bacillus tianshenii]